MNILMVYLWRIIFCDFTLLVLLVTILLKEVNIMRKILLLVLIGTVLNCSSSNIRETVSKAEDMVCEEENAKDCKFQFENY